MMTLYNGYLEHSCNEDSSKIEGIYYRGEGIVKESIYEGEMIVKEYIIKGEGFKSCIARSESIIEGNG